LQSVHCLATIRQSHLMQARSTATLRKSRSVSMRAHWEVKLYWRQSDC